jgi:adhesin transport system membrane fusion protein
MKFGEIPLEDLTDRVQPRTASAILLWGIAAFVVLFIAWGSFTKIDRTVRAQGRVIPSSQLQVVSNHEGGVIEDILVRTGDVVAAGQELVRLDPTQPGSEYGSGEATVGALAVKIARLQAEVSGQEPAYPPASDAEMAEQITIERALHASRMADLASASSAAQARLSAAGSAVGEAEAAYQSRVSARDAAASEAAILRPLVERGIEPRLSLIQAESAAAVAKSDAAAAAQSIGRARSAVAEARAAFAQQRQDWRAQAAGELAEAQGDIAAHRRALPALAQRVEHAVVRSPLAGRVNRVLVTTRGGSVQPGQPLVEIVPSHEGLLVEAQIRPQDIASVAIGQTAHVAISAYDRAIHGTLDGRVVAISPDAVTNEKTGEPFYIVRVRTARTALDDPSGERLPIGPGMVAEVDLLGEKRSVLSYLLTPITRLGESAFRE